MRNRDIFQGDVEFLGTLEEVRSDAVADSFTLGDQFRSIELGDDRLEDFVSNRRQDSLVVILTEILLSSAAISIILRDGENKLDKS